ncbi:MAG: DUF4234 domain-containing protein [Deltaproteobacteria bacterium]|nr:DUF4234 domain-containing protein [Deltaproteobacteria bacterium]
MVVLILTLITCGLYGLLWLWQVGTELEQHLGRDDVNPGLDVLFTVLTVGLWGIYLMYRYPQLLIEAQRKAGLAPHDVSVVSVILAALGLPYVSMVLIQIELNKVWSAPQPSA